MRFAILGPLRIGDASRDAGVTGGRDRIVLAMLLLHPGRIVSIGRLVNALWEDAPPATARGQLQSCVSRLRRILPTESIITDPAGYGVRVGDDELDAAIFHRLTGEARACVGSDPDEARRLFRAGLDLWRGPALDGLDRAPIRQGASVLDEQRIVAIEDWVDLELSGGRERDLLAELVGLVDAFPLRERLRAQLMLALHRAGRQADALAEYRRARLVLNTELGIEPGTQLRELHKNILTGSVSPQTPEAARTRPAPVRCLPRTVGDFTGRSAVVGRLVAAIQRDDATGPVIELIDGMAGSGKTTLALHVATQVAHRYPDAQLFVDLHGHSDSQPVSPAALLVTLLRQIGVPADRHPVDFEERLEMWRSELATRRVLMVLDNAASTAQIAQILPAGPGCLALVTSRRRLTGLDGVRPESIQVLTEPEAVELLERIVGERVTAEPEAATEVVRRCGLLPLAIRVAGSRLAHRPGWRVADLASRLGESVLPELVVEDRAVAGAFALSYGQLEPAAQRMFRLLGLHPGVRYGASDVAALTDLPLNDAVRLIESLVDVHLVEEPEQGRYRMHDLVREYALGLVGIDDEADRRDAVSRLLDHSVHSAADMSARLEHRTALRRVDPAAARRPDLLPDSSADPMLWVDRERLNLLALSREAEHHGEPTWVWMLARAAWRLWFQRAYYDDLVDAHQRGLVATRAAGDGLGEGVMANYLAAGLHRTGQVEAAARMLRVAYDCLREHGDPISVTAPLNNMATIRVDFDDLELVLKDALRSLAIHRRHQITGSMSSVLAVVGLIETRRGRLAEGLAWHRRSLAAAREIGGLRYLGLALNNIAHTRMLMGHAPAERLLRAAIALNVRTGSLAEVAEARGCLGTLCGQRGRFDEAIDHHTRALEVANDIGERRVGVSLRVALAQTLLDAGDPVAAEDLFREAAERADAMHCRYDEARAHQGIAICVVDHDTRGARKHWKLALAIFTRMGTPERVVVERRLACLPTGSGVDTGQAQ
jgi:DNA-binding SARP family transcriptional activator/tetratricopeptide (TPR) repeat protein